MHRHANRCRQARGHEALYGLDHRLRGGHEVVHDDGRLAGVVSLTDVILRVEENGPEIAESLRPRVAEVLRVISQKERGVRTVRVNPFRED